MKKAISFIFLAAALGVAALATPPRNAPDCLSYLKTPDRNRVMIYAGDLDPAQARAALAGVMHTAGRVTAAYLYPAADLAPPILAADYLGAVAAIEETAPAWACRVIIGPDAAPDFAGACSDG